MGAADTLSRCTLRLNNQHAAVFKLWASVVLTSAASDVSATHNHILTCMHAAVRCVPMSASTHQHVVCLPCVQLPTAALNVASVVQSLSFQCSTHATVYLPYPLYAHPCFACPNQTINVHARSPSAYTGIKVLPALIAPPPGSDIIGYSLHDPQVGCCK